MKWQSGFEHEIVAIIILLGGLTNIFKFNISLWVRRKSTNKRDKYEDAVNVYVYVYVRRLLLTSHAIRRIRFRTVTKPWPGEVQEWYIRHRGGSSIARFMLQFQTGCTLFSSSYCIRVCMHTENRKVIYASRNIWNPINWLICSVGSSFIHHYFHVTTPPPPHTHTWKYRGLRPEELSGKRRYGVWNLLRLRE
jgi:hypothetical protein